MTLPLGAQILAAHAASDKSALVSLYTLAADDLEAGGDINGTCFFLTYAYVFALETGHVNAPTLHRRLHAYGRET